MYVNTTSFLGYPNRMIHDKISILLYQLVTTDLLNWLVNRISKIFSKTLLYTHMCFSRSYLYNQETKTKGQV